MITFEEAFDIVMSNAIVVEQETVPLALSLGRVLAKNIYSDIEFPSNDLSAMDGYAAKRSELNSSLRIIETIAAGQVPAKSVGTGECSRIMTGAIVPDGADCVVMFEHAKEEKDIVTVTKIISNNNIRKNGEELHKGDEVCSAGTLITPSVVASLAFSGIDPVPVARKPVVGVITTGSELVPTASMPPEGKIRDSNGPQLCAQILNAGALVHHVGVVEDRKEILIQAIKEALSKCDVLVLSGGVSVGLYDFVPEAVAAVGAEILIHSVSVKPGKPMLFASKGSKKIFGLPGNPVSVFVQFEVIIKPFLMKMMGASYELRKLSVVLAEEIKRKKADRKEFLPVVISQNGGCSMPTYKGSAHIHAYSKATGIIAMPIGVDRLNKGTIVEMILL